MIPEITLGATYLGGGRCRFRVWAPSASKVEVRIALKGDRTIALKEEGGYHEAIAEGVLPGTLYTYRLDERLERPDPASRFQPHGVHGPSEVVDREFPWEDNGWFGLPLRDYVLYELHVGVYTPEGTFRAILPHLDELADLGVTAVEIMPVAQFPGERNWGYDGVYPFAVQNSYGGPHGLKELVNACHAKGLAVVLDVVYNHLGPEGNYLRDFGPYFTDRYRTPWGQALNFDGPYNQETRRFFIENALYWITEFHLDALRIDAIHAIPDLSAEPFLKELAGAVEEQAEKVNRRAYLIAESDLNDARAILPAELGGYGLHAQWNDDFHHALHALLTEDRAGYYQDFGTVHDLARSLQDGYVYEGEYSRFRRRRHGNSSRQVPAERFVVFAQNHDQVGNRMLGERLGALVPPDGLKVAAAAVLLSPFLPLLFMGEEFGETAPFQYFVSHSDPDLVDAVRRGRKAEFAAFQWVGEPPDPQAEETFLRCKLSHGLRRQGPHRDLLGFYRELIRLRRTLPSLAFLSKRSLEVFRLEEEKVLAVRRWREQEEALLAFNFGPERISASLPVPRGEWRVLIDSDDARWNGRGSVNPSSIPSDGRLALDLRPRSFLLLGRTAGG